MISTSLLVQVTVILLLATVLFFVAYRLPMIISSSALLAIIPIQPIDSQYASANVLLTYVIFLAMLLKGENVRLPLLPQFLLLLFCYLLSMSFVHKALYTQHALYMFSVVSAYMVCCIAYDLTRRFEIPRGIVNVFLAMNVVVVIYCFIQLVAGPGVKVIPFGIQEMAMIPGRVDKRLTGPFAATGVTAEYLVIMVFLISHRLLFSDTTKLRYPLIILAGINLALLVATGNRGGFLSLLGGGVLFLWLLRKDLGVLRSLRLFVSGGVMLALASAAIITFSDFGRLFERLEATTMEEGIPDTRLGVWPGAWEKIKERPILGHGPRFMMQGGEQGLDHPGWEYQPYPHNLYLYLLSTIGVVGLIAFLLFIMTPMVRCYKNSQLPNLSVEGRTFIKTGFVIFVIIMVDQIKVEFMRFALVDYWHFAFALLGVFVAACDSAKAGAHHLTVFDGANESDRMSTAIPATSASQATRVRNHRTRFTER